MNFFKDLNNFTSKDNNYANNNIKLYEYYYNIETNPKSKEGNNLYYNKKNDNLIDKNEENLNKNIIQANNENIDSINNKLAKLDIRVNISLHQALRGI